MSFGMRRLLKTALGRPSAEFSAVRQDQIQRELDAYKEELYRKTEQLRCETARRARVEEAAQQSENRLHQALAFAKCALWTWRVNEDVITWSGPVEKVLGIPCSHLRTYALFRNYVHEEDRKTVDLLLERAAHECCDYTLEFRLVLPDTSVCWVSGFGGGIADPSDQSVSLTGVLFDITYRKLAEQKLETSERKFRELAEAMPQIVWTANADGEFEYYNAIWYEVTGFPTSLPPREHDRQKVIHPEDFGRWNHLWSQAVRSGLPYEIEYRFLDTRTQQYCWYLGRAIPIEASNGYVTRWFGTCTDIHERKTEQERLERQVQSRTEALRSLLTEKETLLKELHHRVKNNLQVISSLLQMQAGSLNDETAITALTETQHRVLSMSLVHERLYGGQRMDEVDFSDYARALVDSLLHSYAGIAPRVTSRFQLEPVSLGIDQAIPCGLILNELVTNALKYAYPNGTAGEISVEVRRDSNDGILLRVSDNGIGLPTGLDWKNSKSMGLPIVDLLAKQLCGTLTVSSGKGVSSTLTFPSSQRQTAVPAA